MDDFIRARFYAAGDRRQVITDPDARYFGAMLDDHTIVPVDGEDVTIFPTRFGDWMAARATTGSAAGRDRVSTTLRPRNQRIVGGCCEQRLRPVRQPSTV